MSVHLESINLMFDVEHFKKCVVANLDFLKYIIKFLFNQIFSSHCLQHWAYVFFGKY